MEVFPGKGFSFEEQFLRVQIVFGLFRIELLRNKNDC